MRGQSLIANRWMWLVIGVILLVFSIVTFANAHIYQPMEISGTVHKVRDVFTLQRYEHSELSIDGDSTIYTFNMVDFTPSLPTTPLHEVHIWVEDPGSTTIIALQYYDDQHPDTHATKYTTDLYNHPEHGVSDAHTLGIFSGIVSLPLLLLGLFWPIFPWGRKKQR